MEDLIPRGRRPAHGLDPSGQASPTLSLPPLHQCQTKRPLLAPFLILTWAENGCRFLTSRPGQPCLSFFSRFLYFSLVLSFSFWVFSISFSLPFFLFLSYPVFLSLPLLSPPSLFPVLFIPPPHSSFFPLLTFPAAAFIDSSFDGWAAEAN